MGGAALLWLERSALATAVRESAWLYPAIETVHLVGIVLLVGGAVTFDLRLLGVARRLPAGELGRHLLRCARAGALLAVPSGVTLLSAHATKLAANPALPVKLALVALAFANAGFFHLRTARTMAAWDVEVPPPPAARAAGALSIGLWAGVIACGRLLAYL